LPCIQTAYAYEDPPWKEACGFAKNTCLLLAFLSEEFHSYWYRAVDLPESPVVLCHCECDYDEHI
jgi:hypothetical protein